jgi:hypothetical protein
MVIASLHIPRVQGLLAKRVLAAITVIALGFGPLCAQRQPEAAQTAESDDARLPQAEIVVDGVRDIVVNGRARRCRAVADDPLNDVKRADGPELMAIVPDGSGGYVSAPNAEQITGAEFWQRVGVGMSAFVFRGPSAGKPMCVGGGEVGTNNFAGFRRIVDATPYRGHRLRFTAWVATGRARQVSFWLAAGTEWRQKPPPLKGKRTPFNKLLDGGNTNSVPFGGDHGWTPVLLETVPLPEDADHVSYGFNLQGWGDAWVYDPRLEVVDQPEGSRTGDRIVIGRDQD